MAGKFIYKARAASDWSARSDQKAGGYIGIFQSFVSVFSVQKSDNYIRLLPPTWPDAVHYGFDVWVHYGVGPQNATVLCLAKHNRGRCPICEAHAVAEAAGREDAKSLRAGRRVVAWILDLRDDKVKTPKVFSMPWSLDRDITKICKDKDTGEVYAIDDPEEGYNVGFDREGEVPMVKYVGLQLARRPSTVDEAALDFIVEHPIPDIFTWRSYDEVVALFEGAGPSETPKAEPEVAAEPPAKVAAPRTVVTNGPGTVSGYRPDLVAAAQAEAVQVVETVEEVSADFCDKTFNFKGQKFGCEYAIGHDGECSFERELGPIVEAPKPAPTPAPRAVVARPVAAPAARPVTTPTPAASPAPAVNDRLASMRNRFGANK